MITGTTTYEHKLTPLELEMELWQMDAEEQACFLHNLATRWLHNRLNVELQIENILDEIDGRTKAERDLIHDFLTSFDEYTFAHLNEQQAESEEV